MNILSSLTWKFGMWFFVGVWGFSTPLRNLFLECSLPFQQCFGTDFTPVELKPHHSACVTIPFYAYPYLKIIDFPYVSHIHRLLSFLRFTLATTE